MIQPLVGAFGEEFTGVLSALVGGATTSDAAAPPVTGDGWIATITADAPARGTWKVFVGNAGAAAITAGIMGLTADEPVPVSAIGDTLRETLGQALGALSLKAVARGATLRLGDLSAGMAPAAADIVATVAITCGAMATPVTMSVCGLIELAVPGTPAAPLAAVGAAVAHHAPAASAGAGSAATAGAGSDRLDAILDIELPLVVRFGRTELPLRTLANLGPGSLIDLGRSADDPVDLLVSNRVVARGEVVVVGGNYGVRVLDVVSPRDRARSMEA